LKQAISSYLGKGDIGDNDGVHSARGSAEGLASVTVRVVLVLVDLAILRLSVPGHGALANADVALGVHGSGLAAEVPILSRIPNKLAIVRISWSDAPLGDEIQSNDSQGIGGRHNCANEANWWYEKL
jgi:hypothetical protein